jgi:hypothetical protein
MVFLAGFILALDDGDHRVFAQFFFDDADAGFGNGLGWLGV